MKKLLFLCLIVTYFAQAQDYAVQPIPYNPPAPFYGGTPISAGNDDVFSPIFDLPFDFVFYGIPYNQMIVSSNGIVSFDVSNAGGFSQWSIVDNIPTTAIQTNAIFGVYHDIFPTNVDPGFGINFGTMGTAPNRMMYINFPNIPMFSCSDLISTTQIVYYESTNNIEVYIEEKYVCTWNEGRAILGIQNAQGDLAHVPDGRNGLDTPWEATNEGWLFGNLNFVTLGSDFNSCEDQAALEFDLYDPDFTYQWSLNGTVIPGETESIYEASEDGLYSVEGTNASLSFTDEIEVIFVAKPEISNEPSPIFINEGDNDGVAVFDLTVNENQMLGSQDPSLIQFSYFETALDCSENSNQIAVPTAYQNMENPQTIFVRLENINSGCFVCTNFSIETDALIGLDDIILETLKVYPNPAHDFIILESHNLAFGKILIRDLMGRTIQNIEGVGSAQTIDISALNDGVYFMIVKSNGTAATKRFIKE